MAGRFLTQTQMNYIRYLTQIENSRYNRAVKNAIDKGHKRIPTRHWRVVGGDEDGRSKKSCAVLASHHSLSGGQYVEGRPITRRGVPQRGKFDG